MTNDDTHRTDLVRLVQHVALNQSGWWKQAVERLLLACAYTVGASSRSQLCEAVQESSGVVIMSERLADALDELLRAGSLVEHQDLIRVSEATREELHKYEESIMSSEERVRAKFSRVAQARGLADRSDELWSILETEVILPITRHMGAGIYELLTSSDPDSRSDISSHIEAIDDQYGKTIRDFFYHFIDPKDDDIRGFVLRRLNAQYVADAAALPAAALDRLARQRSVPSRVRLMVDTNFLFSILELHDNPGNEEANKLLQLVNDVSSRVKLQLYVLPITVEEARSVVSDVALRLSDFRGQPNLAKAAKNTRSLGLSERYLEAASRSPTNLTPTDFFGPYQSDLLTVLRSKSVELYNDRLDELRTDQEVIDDMFELSEIQRVRRRGGEKSYEANRHDMVLWHFARRQRSASLSSPLEASTWVVTLDKGLIFFERRRLRNGEDMQTPVCLEPGAIIQLFQFWVPSSEELDEALVGSIRQPLLFLNFGVESEQVTLRILAQLSRFDGAGDLPPDVALEILTNKALRQRMSGADTDRAIDEEMVGEQLLEMVDRLAAERDEARKDARSQSEHVGRMAPLADTARREKSLREDAENRLRKLRERERSSDKLMSELTADVSDRDSRIAELERLHTKLQERFDERDRTVRQMKVIRRAGVKSLFSVLASVMILIGSVVALNTHVATALACTAGGALSLLVLLIGLEASLRNTPLADSKMYTWIRQLRKTWWAFALAVAASLVAAWLDRS